ncbi:hypothetical protein SAMN05216320_1011340 [Duganella sp. OV458]|nr:hypothetical protein SAMN05216320_1011340 [Duganella sp. OV458]SDI49837.1 hypothetical protein SAMN05428973_10175 [Duganella sp. OV510]
MLHPDQRRQPPASRTPALTLVQSFDPSIADVLHAIETLTAKVDQLHTLLAPRKSALTLDPDEIARTMDQLKMARPLPKETSP